MHDTRTTYDYPGIPVPTIDAPRWRSTTIDGLLTWTPGPRSRSNRKAFGNWSVEVDPETGYRTIRHYGTWMLGIRCGQYHDGGVPASWGPGYVDHTSIGHGSVSDQQMMNRLFRALGSDLYFSRRGGASIG